jgi:hypothetical protein
MAWNQTVKGQLGASKHGPRRGTGLLPAVLALEQTPGEAAVPGRTELGALEAMRPAGLADGLDALVLATVAGHELTQGRALLELDAVSRHRDPPPKHRSRGATFPVHLHPSACRSRSCQIMGSRSLG